MKFISYLTVALFGTRLAFAASLPQTREISVGGAEALPTLLQLRDFVTLERRKGGGGGAKGGGSSGGGASSGGKGGGSSSSGSNAGGRTQSGSGAPPAYAGGYYAGGARVPYTSGGRSPTRSVAPYLLGGAALGVFPGLWLYSSVYAYPYGLPYYYNHNGRNETVNGTCLCQQYSVCGCDDANNQTLIDQIVTNGTNAPVNTSTVRTVTYDNGTSAFFVNGTLDNGTTADGGTDASNASQVSTAAQLFTSLAQYWVMIAIVIAGVTMV